VIQQAKFLLFIRYFRSVINRPYGICRKEVALGPETIFKQAVQLKIRENIANRFGL